MAKHPDYSDIPKMRASGNDEDKAVPVEVKILVWVKRSSWLHEHGLEPHNPDLDGPYDFEEAVQDWVRAEVQEAFVEQGEWPNVTEVTE